MATRKFEERNVRKLQKVGRGRTVSVTLPIEFIRTLGWKEKQKVVISMKGGVLSIKGWVGKK